MADPTNPKKKKKSKNAVKISDPVEFNRREQAYNDSLDLYNSYMENIAAIEDFGYTKYRPESKDINLTSARGTSYLKGLTNPNNKFVESLGGGKYKAQDLRDEAVNTELPYQLFNNAIMPSGIEEFIGPDKFNTFNVPDNISLSEEGKQQLLLASLTGGSRDVKPVFNYSNVKPVQPVVFAEEKSDDTPWGPRVIEPPKGEEDNYEIKHYSQNGNGMFTYVKKRDSMSAIPTKNTKTLKGGSDETHRGLAMKYAETPEPLFPPIPDNSVMDIQRFTAGDYLDYKGEASGYINKGDKKGRKDTFANGGVRSGGPGDPIPTKQDSIFLLDNNKIIDDLLNSGHTWREGVGPDKEFMIHRGNIGEIFNERFINVK